MKFDQFKQHVKLWADQRGIYAYSTSEAQLLKALSELGEIADAIIKDDIDGIKDGVGDVAVCLVNYAHMEKLSQNWDGVLYEYSTEGCVGELAFLIGQDLANGIHLDFGNCMSWLADIAMNNHLTFEECYVEAWESIKNRKGHMVKGGAFVKDEK